MQRIVIKHKSGSKANQVEEFPLNLFNELIIGRDPLSSIKFDPNRDDLVGRQHAKIAQDQSAPGQFIIMDLNSRNGTFVNRQRIIGTARVSVGDVIQLGAGGPEFEFDLEPRLDNLEHTSSAGSPNALPPTRVGNSGNLPPTRTGDSNPIAPLIASSPHSAVGKATVERMIAQNKGASRKQLIWGAAILLFIIAGVAAALIYQNISSKEKLAKEIAAAAPMAPSEIVKKNINSVVLIEVSWDLVHTPSGDKVYHEYIPNRSWDGTQLINNGKEFLPVYTQSSDGTIEPSLTTKSDGGNQPIGGNLTGSGFVVDSAGYILTNRHVATAWNTSYDLSDALPGILVKLEDEGDAKSIEDAKGKKGKKSRRSISYIGRLDQLPRNFRWGPIESTQFGRKPVRGKLLEGRNIYLQVTFAKTEIPYKAQNVRESNRHDVALILISAPQSVPSVKLHDNYDEIEPGETITILGYPTVSPDVVVGTKSQDPFNRARQFRAIPDPTVTGGLVGKVIRDAQATTRREEYEFFSEFGDSIQLTSNSTGTGNSGGPVFDDRGRVIGIFYARSRLPGDAEITFAVPIRYGMQLMQNSPVIK